MAGCCTAEITFTVSLKHGVGVMKRIELNCTGCFPGVLQRKLIFFFFKVACSLSLTFNKFMIETI